MVTRRELFSRALRSGRWDVLHHVIKKYGTNLLNIRMGYGNWTTLHILADSMNNNGSADCIKKLFNKYGYLLNVDIKNYYEQTPLFFASRKGHYPQMYELIKFGANINIKDENDNTPMSELCKRSYYYDRLEGVDWFNKNKIKCLNLLIKPPKTYAKINQRELLAMILNKRIPLGTKKDIKQMLISIGY